MSILELVKNGGVDVNAQNHKASIKLFFWSGPIGFPSKMMPCKLNHNLICLGLGPSSKGLATNLKLLTNRNVQFHWALLLGPLPRFALTMSGNNLTKYLVLMEKLLEENC
jgi:hypothetical protein